MKNSNAVSKELIKGLNTLKNLPSMPKASPVVAKLSLYNEDYRLTQDGRKLADEAGDAIQPVFDKWMNLGFSPREISQIMSRAVLEAELDAVLGLEYLEPQQSEL